MGKEAIIDEVKEIQVGNTINLETEYDIQDQEVRSCQCEEGGWSF